MGHNTCPYCGANLDPGERCDCHETEKAAQGGNDTKDGKGIISNYIIPVGGGNVK